MCSLKCLITLLFACAAANVLSFGQMRMRNFEVIDGRAKLIVPHKDEADMQTAVEAFLSDWQELYAVPLDTSSSIGLRHDDTPLIIATETNDPILQGRGVNMACVRGCHDAFVLFVTSRGDIVVAGGSPRGTAFGLMHLSEKMGVSPTRDWDGLPTPLRTEPFSLPTHYTSTHWPAVEIRAIAVFEPLLTPEAIERTMLRLGLNDFYNHTEPPLFADLSEDGNAIFLNAPTNLSSIALAIIDGREAPPLSLANARGISFFSSHDSLTDCQLLQSAIDNGANLVWTLMSPKNKNDLLPFASMGWHWRDIEITTQKSQNKRRKGTK